MRLLWIAGAPRHGAAAWLAAPVAPLLARLGWAVTYWPLAGPPAWVPPGFAEVWDAAEGNGLLARLARMGAVRRAVAGFDAVLVEQDLATEFLVAEVLLGLRRRPALWLWATEPLGPYLAGRGEHVAGRDRRRALHLYPRFDRVLALADAVGADLVEHFGVAPQAVRTVTWPAPALAGQTARPAARVVTLGPVDGLKGLEILVQTLALLAQDGVAARLDVVGGGPRLDEVRRVAAATGVPLAVAPLGPDLDRHLAEGVFCAPQWLDGTGWDLVAAAAAGLPLTAVAAPLVVQELTGRGTLARLAPLGDLDALAAALRPLLTDAAQWASYHRAALLLAGRHRPERVEAEWRAALS
ncbi:MAG: glycosyltransferase [Actinomycetia bacterium]|nr:glycosyltransferase [Actinomycetes bacterium]